MGDMAFLDLFANFIKFSHRFVVNENRVFAI